MLGCRVVEAAIAAGHTVFPGTGRIELISSVGVHPDTEVIINCAGLTKQRVSVFPWVAFMTTNALGPHNLALQAEQGGARLIHVSTDCVFEGRGPHLEDGIPDAADVYAISKRAGEVVYGPHLTVRTSFVGFEGRGLLHDLQTLRSVSVSRNLLWSGHTVDTIADVLVMLATLPYLAGMLHIPGTHQNRYTLARDLKARWSLPAQLDRDDEFVADRRLNSDRWRYYGLPDLPTFDEQLGTMRGPQ